MAERQVAGGRWLETGYLAVFASQVPESSGSSARKSLLLALGAVCPLFQIGPCWQWIRPEIFDIRLNKSPTDASVCREHGNGKPDGVFETAHTKCVFHW